MVKGKLVTIVTVNNYKHKHDVFLGSEKINKPLQQVLYSSL